MWHFVLASFYMWYPFSPLWQDISRVDAHNRIIAEANSDFGGCPLPAKKELSNGLLQARSGGEYVRRHF
jgi:hypothetical protein